MKFSEWLEIREEKDACYKKVKSRYSVFPSAYACVPEKTSKALTKEGWKSYKDVILGTDADANFGFLETTFDKFNQKKSQYHIAYINGNYGSLMLNLSKPLEKTLNKP